MAPYNWDNHIKESLEKRQLQPSQDAWGKLSDRLDIQEKRVTVNRFWWIGLAASIVGILFIAMMYIGNEKQPSNKIVDTPKTTIEKVQDIKPVNANEVVVSSDETVEISKSKTEKQVQIIKEPKAINEEIAVVESDKVPSNNTDATTNFENQKIKEVVAQIRELQNNDVVSTDDIDALLKQAEKDILKDKIKNASSLTVDADALLQDVEADLQQSFRAKVFEALKSSYETVKTAVAERNNLN